MNILLNWFPPAFKKLPSPAMSALKGYLDCQGYMTSIYYWNLKLKDIIQASTGTSDKQEANEFDILIPFLAYLLDRNGDRNNFNRLCAYYQSKFPHYFNLNKQGYYEMTLRDSANQIHQMLKETMIRLYNEKAPDLIGVNTSLLQLVPANIFSQLSKDLYHDIPIVAGGISNMKEAIALLNNFEYYDFAIWGEGENPLHQLCRVINNEIAIDEVPNLVFRRDEKIEVNKRNKLFMTLGVTKPDYSDYFEFIGHNNINLEQSLIPVESSRGCHWNQCKFCFLTEGYKNRAKSNDEIIDEIYKSINDYNRFEFVFLDNDIIFDDYEKFDELLNRFIDIKSKFEQFGVWNGEVVTKGLNAAIIKKMVLAGFKSIQIGYEAISDSLLGKIKKKNTFASNLMFVKWASEYNLNLQGLNIITGMIEENDDDIEVSIKNLHYLRFFLCRKIKHEIIPLQIMKTSRYYKELNEKDELHEWCENPLYSLFPHGYIKEEDRFDIMFFSKRERNILWNNFERVNAHYSTSDYKYKIYLLSNCEIKYFEYLDEVIISKLEFEINGDYHWKILTFCNSTVKSLEQLTEYFNMQGCDVNGDMIKNILIELNEEFLLYSNFDFSENITVINTDLVL